MNGAADPRRQPAASPLFLREAEIRRGLELLFFAQNQLARAIEETLEEAEIGRAHQRALYFVARRPGLSVGELLRLLGITKQSLGRVVGDLERRGLVELTVGRSDRRQRLLRLTDTGRALETRLFEALRRRLSTAYAQAGTDAVGGFWAVLDNLIPAGDRTLLAELGRS